jgi:hypothetical protein
MVDEVWLTPREQYRRKRKRSYVVATEQRKPVYMLAPLETFTDKADAVTFATAWAASHGFTQVSKRKWRKEDVYLVVWDKGPSLV